MTQQTPAPQTAPRPTVRNRKDTTMLLEEALARSRQREAEEEARRYRLARHLTAGRRWALLAGFAARRAARARSAAGAPPLDVRVARASGSRAG